MSPPRSATTHTASSWARVNMDMQFRSIIEKVESLDEETRRNRTLEGESHQMILYLRARLHALAAAVADLPKVFQGSVREVVAEQERLHADLVATRQQMREHKAEVTAMLVEARKASVAASSTKCWTARKRPWNGPWKWRRRSPANHRWRYTAASA